MSRQKNLLLVAAGLLGILLLFSVAVLPVILKNSAIKAVQETTGRTVRMESVSLNPFTLAVRVTGFAIEEKGGGAFVSFSALRAAVNPSSLLRRSLILSEVTLTDPSCSIIRTSPTRYNFTDIIERSQATAKTPSKGSPRITIDKISVVNGTVLFSDAVPKGGFKGSLNNITVELKQFSTAEDRSAEYVLSLLVDKEATLSSHGSFSLSPPAVRASAGITNLKLQKGWPYLAQFLTAPVGGSLDLSGDVRYRKADGLLAENGRMTVQNLSIRYGGNEGVDIDSLSVSGAAFRQKENRLEIDEVRLSKGDISLSRRADGKFSAESLLLPQRKNRAQKTVNTAESHTAGSVKSPPETTTGGTGALSYRLKRVEVDHLGFKFRDGSRPDKPSFSFRDTSISLAELNGPLFTPAQLRFSSTFGARTALKGGGEVTPQPFHYIGDLFVGRLPIKDFDSYFPEDLNVIVVNGFLDAAVKLDIALKDGRPVGTFKGNTGVRSFHSIDTAAEEDLLKWESLQLDEFHGSFEPFILNVRKIALNGVYSRIIVRKDGTLNLQNLMQQPETAAAPEKAGALPSPPLPPSKMIAAPSQPQNAGTKKQISIGAVTIQGGTLAFSDNHLPQQFATTFHNLGGRVSGLSSDASRFADVDLRGNLESQSPLQITGKINPLRDDLFVDLKVSFHDIELSPASPYSGSYLGYTIEKGKLYLDLKYHIEKKLLTSENKIFIDQFTFGGRVESDKATTLPVHLGLALLKDRNGEIHLDVPVTGRTDAPEIRIWKIVFQALKNVVIKAVTSPLALLSSLFGGGDDFSAIEFMPGSGEIPPGEESKLNGLSRALLERPALKMELKGYVDREKDIEAYRTALLKRKLNREKFLTLGRQGKLPADETEDSVQVTAAEYDTYLTAVYNREKFPKPRDVLGLVKKLAPEEMKKLIIINTTVGDAELHALARERVAAVLNHLVGKGNIPPERIFQNDTDLFKAPEKESISRSRVEVSAIMK